MAFLGIVIGMMLDVIIVPAIFIGIYSRNILMATLLGAVSGVAMHVLTSFFWITQKPVVLIIPHIIAGCLLSLIFYGAACAVRKRKAARHN
ncbi:MAG: hypothetical protein KKF77_03825 [Proteobacteria bacterium]|nr:hypothetical protein [Pseudomonadota bacterium]